MKRIGVIFTLFVMLMSSYVAMAQQDGGAAGVDGLVSVGTADSVPAVVAQLETTIAERGLTLIATVDHAGNAESVGRELRPTQLVIFGNPNLGTQLMNNQQSVGIDLPQKYLVWEDDNGDVHVSYNAPDYLQTRHGLTGPDEVLTTITNALAGISGSVAETTAVTLGVSAVTVSGLWMIVVAILVTAGVTVAVRKRVAAIVLMILAVPFILTAVTAQTMDGQTMNGLITIESVHSVDETVSRLQSEITERGLTIMKTVNHGANAENVGRELRPTQLILFGNPNLGTQLMDSQQTVGIDLPQKFLVWEDENGATQITYNEPQYIADRHGITDRDEVLTTVTNALGAIAGSAGGE